jgi:deoxyadenosine/deoxycytidine kinase
MKIVIDSNIGGGKTTLINRISQQTRLPTFLEPVIDWNEYLDLFYKDPQKWAFAFNLKVLCSYSEWINNKFNAIYERSPYTCRYVFTELQVEENQIHPLELKVFDKIFEQMSWKPDIIIYIKTNPEICYNRMTTRGRACEEKVPLDYLIKLDKMHDKYINNIKKTVNVYEIDGNNDEETVYNDVMKILVNV